MALTCFRKRSAWGPSCGSDSRMNCITSSTVQDEGSRLLSRETSREPRYLSDPGDGRQSCYWGVPGTAPQSFPLNPPLSSSPTAGQRHSKGHVPVVPQIPAAQVWHTEALFPLLRPDFSGRPSILSPCPLSQPPLPLFVPSSHSSLSIG